MSVTRRSALKRIASAAVAPAMLPAAAEAATPAPPVIRPPTDPDLMNPVVPWAKVLTKPELRTLGALCDVILPADERSPAATKVGVPAFIDEWIGAPYELNQTDQTTVRGGLVWLDTESGRRFSRPFADASPAQQHQICDDICALPRARPHFKQAAAFFERARELTVSGFYTTLEGMKDIGYVGNVPAATFDGPPREVLVRLKLVPASAPPPVPRKP